MRQARGREMAKVRLIGTEKGTLPVTMRHRQSMPPLAMDLRESQHWEVGDDVDPLEELLVRKFMQGVKALITDALHGVLIWALAGPPITTTMATTTPSHHPTRRPISLFSSLLFSSVLGDLFEVMN